MKKALIILTILIAIAAGCFFSFLYGVNKVRNGLVENYPTVKNLVQGAVTQVDSSIAISLTKSDNEALFNLLNGDSKSDTIQISASYYGRYGIDLAVRNFRLFRDEQTVEVWLPPMRLLYCDLRIDRMLINGKRATEVIKEENYFAAKAKLNEYLVPIIEKNKSHQKAAKTTLAKALMFYFMPYKFDLKFYIDNEQQTLPLVPGVNQSVDDAINQMLGR